MRAAIALVASLALACTGISSRTNSFASLEEARSAGAMAAGWVPDGLPPGTHDIREAHLPGSTERWGLFDFPPEQGDVLRSRLQSDEVPLNGVQPGAPKRIEWWPIPLRGSIDADRLALTGIKGYRSKDAGLIFAVQWAQGRAYYWPAR